MTYLGALMALFSLPMTEARVLDCLIRRGEAAHEVIYDYAYADRDDPPMPENIRNRISNLRGAGFDIRSLKRWGYYMPQQERRRILKILAEAHT